MFKTTKNYAKDFLPKQVKEENHKPSLTDKSSYVPLHIMLQNMEQAGIRLADHRSKLKFDFELDEMLYFRSDGLLLRQDKATGKWLPADVSIQQTRNPNFNLEDWGVLFNQVTTAQETIPETPSVTSETPPVTSETPPVTSETPPA